MHYLILALLNGFLVALVTGFILSPDRAKKLPGGSMMVGGAFAYSDHQRRTPRRMEGQSE